MRDISRTHSPTERVHEPQLSLSHISPPTFIERVVGRVNQIGGSLSRKTNLLPEPTVIAPIERPKRRMPRGVATKAMRAAKRGATRAREEVKKPGRKTAVVQTVALGALFALFLNGTPTFKQNAVDATNEQTTTRRYLPNIAADPKLTPFDATAALTSTGQQVSLYGWVTPWNIETATSDMFNAASAFWLTVGEDGSSVIPKADWSLWDTYKIKRTLAQTYLTVTGDPNHTYKALANLDVQSAHIAALLTTVKDRGFDGIDIDYEGLGTPNRELFTSFIRNLSTAFHQSGKKVAVTLEARLANEVPMDWQALGQLADEIRIMAYDYHARSTAEPGSIAPISWVAEVVAYAVDRIEPSKLVIGLGNYGYDWVTPLNETESYTGTGISFEQAMAISAENKAPVIRNTGIDTRGYDIGTIPSFTYTDTQGRLHHVWFEDAVSLQEKVNVVAGYQAKGIMFWSVGAGDPAFWQPNQ